MRIILKIYVMDLCYDHYQKCYPHLLA